MQRSEETLTYKQQMTRSELTRVMKDVGAPMGVFALALFTISSLNFFGSRLICPLAGIMWVAGVIVGAIMPSQRREVLDQTLMVMTIYLLTLCGFQTVLGMVSGVSSEMIAASFQQALPTTTGNTFTGYLNTAIWFTTVLTPIGEIGMQVKRVLQFRKTQSIQKAFGQERGLRSGNKSHMSPH